MFAVGALPVGIGAAAPVVGFVSAAPSCAQKGGKEMIKTRNWYQVRVCGAVREAGRCPSLCHSEGGCFCTDSPEPGVVLSEAELKRRAFRAGRVMAKLNIERLNNGRRIENEFTV